MTIHVRQAVGTSIGQDEHLRIDRFMAASVLCQPRTNVNVKLCVALKQIVANGRLFTDERARGFGVDVPVREPCLYVPYGQPAAAVASDYEVDVLPMRSLNHYIARMRDVDHKRSVEAAARARVAVAIAAARNPNYNGSNEYFEDQTASSTPTPTVAAPTVTALTAPAPAPTPAVAAPAINVASAVTSVSHENDPAFITYTLDDVPDADGGYGPAVQLFPSYLGDDLSEIDEEENTGRHSR